MNKINTIFIGDSLTYGYGVDKKSCWVYKLSKELNISYLNKGLNGDTTSSMLERYYEDVVIYNPKYVFIMGGSNDLLCMRSSSSIIENISLMIKDSINKSNILIGIPPCIVSEMAFNLFSPSSSYKYAEKELIVLRKKLIELCIKYKIKYIDFYEETKNKKELFLDGIHLTKEGHNILYKKALKAFL
ncbi:GDSL-type esterase/lipase family protein [Clostridium sp. BJN0001]|uniref:GDSL-type esterase/lipase family protein n=1 Tax=Clostridium sp. BJN0001 TaxID=2930219 RepID=UPI001FD1DCF5|nr:GDSL-type esterase/lipase family protein [Clostridium sp. BJN0001]